MVVSCNLVQPAYQSSVARQEGRDPQTRFLGILHYLVSRGARIGNLYEEDAQESR